MENKKVICRTKFDSEAVDAEVALAIYGYLVAEIPWVDGVRSRKGFTRKAHAGRLGEIPEIDNLITQALAKLASVNYTILGYYLNFYENGEMYTPNHSHKGSHQLVISLGAARTLNVAKKSYIMTNGSAILFGSSTHGIPKEPECQAGRISIATFMVPT